jgi:hypothetical protein
MSFDKQIGRDYWKRYFDDINRNKLEEKFKIYKKKNNTLTRTSLNTNERIIGGVKKELISYKKMLHDEQQQNDKLRAELFSISQKNINYKTQLNNIQKQLDKYKS